MRSGKRIARMGDRCQVVGIVGVTLPRTGLETIRCVQQVGYTVHHSLLGAIGVHRALRPTQGIEENAHPLSVLRRGVGQVEAAAEVGLPLFHHFALVVVQFRSAHHHVERSGGAQRAYGGRVRYTLVGGQAAITQERVSEAQVLRLRPCLQLPSETIAVLHRHDGGILLFGR